MREVWVPTEFNRATFEASGVDPAKLRVVPEPVDVAFFDPTKHKPLPLPAGQRVFGPARPLFSKPAAAAAGEGGDAGAAPFVFLFVGKWEARKVRGALYKEMRRCPDRTASCTSSSRWRPCVCRAGTCCCVRT